MFLLDTNVVSESRRGRRGNPGVVAWLASVAITDLFISALVLGELRKGIAMSRRRQDYVQAENLDAWLRSLIHPFSERILPVDAEIADAWGEMYAIRNVLIVDGLLAATAKVHNLTLVTRNTSQVQGLGVDLLNPFTD